VNSSVNAFTAVRVTRVGGDGVLWGILPSLNADGTISITLGQIL
jgi:hypothetical protein